jgi:hypothetical protein
MADPSPQKPSPSSEPSTAELSSPENVPLVFPSADRSDSPDAPSSPEPAALEEPSTSAGPSTAVPRRPKKTKRSNKISTFVQFQRELLSCIRKDHGSSEAFVQEFHEKKTCADQVNFIYDSMMRYDLMQDKYTKDVKNDKKAKKHRDKADHLLVTGQPAAALELYTRSIMKAESEEMLGMAYANRSAALAKLDLFEEALMVRNVFVPVKRAKKKINKLWCSCFYWRLGVLLTWFCHCYTKSSFFFLLFLEYLLGPHCLESFGNLVK